MSMSVDTTDDDSTQFMEPTVTSIIANVDAAVREATRLVATGEVDLGTVVVDINEAWDAEERKVAQFVACGYSCNLGPNHTPCHMLFSPTQKMRDE